MTSSLWGWKTPEALLRELTPGDIIEFHRGAFSHYALYMGKSSNGVPQVCNVCAEGKEYTSALIELRNYMTVCGSSKVQIQNHDDIAKKHYNKSPRSSSEILAVARRYVDEDWTYNFMKQNCEFYCTLWRFGVGFSTQVVDLEANTNLEVPKWKTEQLEYRWYKQFSKNLPGSLVDDDDDSEESSCSIM